MAGRRLASSARVGVASRCRSEDSADSLDDVAEGAGDSVDEATSGDDDNSSVVNQATADTPLSPSSSTSTSSARTSSMFVEVNGADNSRRFVCVEPNWRNERGFFGGRRRRQSQRERSRHDTENAAFAELRKVIPIHPPDRKLSKHDILRRAIRYIQLLSDVLRYPKGDDVSRRCHTVVPSAISPRSSCDDRESVEQEAMARIRTPAELQFPF